MQLSPATDRATAGRALSVPSSSPSGAMRRATTVEDDPFGPMNDDTATTTARVRCAEFILDRAHGKPAYLEDPNRDPDFVPLAERLKAYVRRDQILAAEGKVVQILPPPKG